MIVEKANSSELPFTYIFVVGYIYIEREIKSNRKCERNKFLFVSYCISQLRKSKPTRKWLDCIELFWPA